MGSLKRKSAFVLSCALLLSTDTCFAANNTVKGVIFEKNENGITANVLTQNEYSSHINATKSGQYYNIVLPNSTKDTSATCGNFESIESCRITTVPSSDGSSYTKIQIKVPSDIVITAKNTAYSNATHLNNEEEEFTEETEQELLTALEGDSEVAPEEAFSERTHGEESLEEEGSEVPDFEDPNFSDSTEQHLMPENQVTPEPTTAPTSTYKPIDDTNKLSANHVQELMYGGIAVGLIAVIILLIYYASRDKIKQQMGDMDIDISDPKKKKAKKDEPEKEDNKAKSKPKQKAPKPRTEMIDLGSSNSYTPPQMETPPFVEEVEPIIDIESLYVPPTPPRTPIPAPIVEEEEDIDDFLSSFADKDDDDEENALTDTDNNSVSYTETISEPEEEPEFAFQPADIATTEEDPAVDEQQPQTDEQEEILSVEDLLEGEELTPSNSNSHANEADEDEDVYFENPIENLMDDMLTTEGMSFSEADVEFIQKQLQVDVTPELLEEFRLVSQTAAPSAPIMTLEIFDQENPALSDEAISNILKKGMTFNSVDTHVIHDMMTSLEISDDSITDARIRKEQEDQANIDYYQSEADFAFTLIKPQDMDKQDEIIVLDENYYPDLENVDFSGDAIFQEFSLIKPEEPNYTEELNLAPTLDDLMMSDYEPPIVSDEIAAMANSEPEFRLIEPEVQTEPEEQFEIKMPSEPEEQEEVQPINTEFLDKEEFSFQTDETEDIEAQFKALGVDFSGETENNNTEKEVETGELEPSFLDSPVVDSNSIEDNKTTEKSEIFAKCSIDETTKLYITQYEGKNILVGMKNDKIKPLFEFPESTVPSSISTRVAEKTDNSIRYIVRADKFKSVVEVSEDDINLVLVL